MTRSTVVLGILLGISLLFNGMAAARLQRLQPAAKAPPAPLPDPALAAIREELNALRKDLASTPAPDRPAAPIPGPAAETGRPDPGTFRQLTPGTSRFRDPRIAEIVEQESRDKVFWDDLQALCMKRREIGQEKYLDLVLETTADHFGIEGAAKGLFRSAALEELPRLTTSLKELAERSQARSDAYWKKYREAGSPERFGAPDDGGLTELREQCTIAQGAAIERLKACLDPSRKDQERLSNHLVKLLQFLLMRD